jgi:Ca-activated chloride channel family protein
VFSFYTPWALLLFLLVGAVIAYRWFKWNKHNPLTFPSFKTFEKLGFDKPTSLGYIPMILRVVALVLLVIAIARPRSATDVRETHTEGIDIIVTLDISSSMLAEDFHPQNRIGAAKVSAKEFISGRVSDRIGLVVFSGESYTQCPLTLDYDIIKEFIDRIQIGAIEDGTAIGMAVVNGLNRLRESKAKSKVIILLTDGQNNRGEIDPLTAAQAASALKVKIYTIGVGTEGVAPYPIQTPWGIQYQQIPVKIDEELLKEMAKMTGGAYFRATDENKLRQIYTKINKLEKTKIEVKEYRTYRELFLPYIIIALILLFGEIILTGTRLRKIP